MYGSLSSQEKKEKQEIFYLIERNCLEKIINLETHVKNEKGNNILTIQMPIDSESLQEDPLAILPIVDDFEKRAGYAPYIRFLQALGKSTIGPKNGTDFMTNYDAYFLEALMMENPKIFKEVQTEHINAMIEFVPNGAQMNMIDEVLGKQEWINMLWGLE